jgi:hypothetical protein
VELDRWHVLIDGVEARAAGSPAAGGPGRLEELTLVLDRTCPDRELWSDAYLLAGSGGTGAEPKFNAGVRAGLAEGLRACARPDLTVRLVWFADRAGESLVKFDGVADPGGLAGHVGEARADGLDGLLAFCPYSPGIDLWDPLEEGLRLAAEPLLDRPRPGSAILLVGNSPPNLPLQADSPFWGLLDFQKRGTTTRRKSALFPDLVTRLDRAGVPLAYLFLTHDQCDPNHRDDLGRFLSLQGEVKEALRFYLPGAVVEAPADADGIAAGLERALALLSEPRVSGVEVRTAGG